MSNGLVVWDSPNGLDIPTETTQIQEIVQYNIQLTPREIKQLITAYSNNLYDMATEYVWTRTINILREKILAFGDDFVLEMLGRNKSDSPEFLSEMDTINLAADLGFINKTAKMYFLQINEIIRHFSSRDTEEEMDKLDAQKSIKMAVKYVLGLDNGNFQFSFNNFRDQLKLSLIKEEDETFRLLLSSPYFYKRTTVRTLLNLLKTSKGAELENVFSNMVLLIPNIWEELLSDDRWPIGFSYAEAVNNGNANLVRALKSILLKVKGFDYVPENLRSLTFIEAGKNLLEAHFAMDNFHNEPALARTLLSLGTSIPTPALGTCITASLACKIGTPYGVSNKAQEYLDQILEGLSPGRWSYYLNQVLPVEETILYKLQQSSIIVERWNKVVNDYEFDKLKLKNIQIEKLVNASINKKATLVKNIARELYDKVR